jgi:hypothetical protein
MPLAKPATGLTTTAQAIIISYGYRRTRPGPVPSHWRNAGPMLLADDNRSPASTRIVSGQLADGGGRW